jgi:Tfp pilus assembly protein PilF
MRRISLLLVLAMSVGGCAQFGGPGQSLRALIEKSGQTESKLTAYEQGKRYLQLGSEGLAIAAFQMDLSENPTSTRALNGLAVSYQRLGRYDVAQNYLDLAITMDPQSAVTLNNLSYLNVLRGKSVVALEYAERAQAAASASAIRLPAEIINAVSRNSEIARELARDQAHDIAAKQTLSVLEMSPDIEQTGANAWLLSVPRRNYVKTAAPTPILHETKKESSDWTSQLPGGAKVRISNGTGRHLMATRFAGYLSHHGLTVHRITNAGSFDHRESAIFYNPDERGYAFGIANLLPFPIKLIEAKKGSGQIEFILGTDLLAFDDGFAPA